MKPMDLLDVVRESVLHITRTTQRRGITSAGAACTR